MNTTLPQNTTAIPHIEAMLLQLVPAPATAPMPPPATFLPKARLIAREAAKIRQLGIAFDQIGFKPLPLPDYLSLVAAKAKIELREVLPDLQKNVLAGCAALARQIAIPVRQIALLVRAAFAEDLMPRPATALARASGQTEQPGPRHEAFAGLDAAALEATLSHVEKGYDAATTQRLAHTLAELGLQA